MRPVAAGYGPVDADGRPDRFVQAVALIACVAAGCKIDLFKGVTAGVVLLIILAPVWWPVTRRRTWMRIVLGLVLLALLVGSAMAWLVADQRAFDLRGATSGASLVVYAFATPVLLLWANTVLARETVVLAFASGIGVYLLEVPSIWSAGPWKFGFSEPVTIAVLAVVAAIARRSGRRRTGVDVVALITVSLVSVVNDFRSQVGFLFLTALVLVWQAGYRSDRRRVRAWSPAVLLAASAGFVYLVAAQLFLNGTFGSDIQARTQEQIDSSGSLLLGGRPEWSATVELMKYRPQGYGFGVLADSRDVQFSINGFTGIHVDPATGFENYIMRYMLADGFHLHSTAADLWATSGPAGLLLAAGLVVLLARSVSMSLSVGRADAVTVFAAVTAVWDVAFSPLYGSATQIAVALFLTVTALDPRRATPLVLR